MIPAIIGAVASIGGALYGGYKAGKSMDKYNAEINKSRAENEAWYNREYNADYTQRADAQNLLGRVRDFAKSNVKRAEGMAAITGATPEAEAIAKNQANEMMADTVSNISAQASQYKQGIMNRYLGVKSNLDALKAEGYKNQADSFSSLAGNSIGAAGGILGSLIKPKVKA